MMQIYHLLNRYTEILKEFFHEKLSSVAVFGSAARGTAKFPQSDIDILIVIENVGKLSFGERIKLTNNVEDELSRTEEYAKFKHAFGGRPKFQEIIFSQEELRAHPPILLDLTTDAVILYDMGILSEEIDKLRKRLKELGARKVVLKDSWFWVLKPDVKLGEKVEL